MLTRRDFLKMVGMGAATLFLGCSSKEVEKPERQKAEQVPSSPYCERYEHGWPKFKDRIKEYSLNLPDFPGYRIKYGNYALNSDGAVIPPKEIEKREDAVWYSYNKDAVKDIDAFVWDGVILDLTDAVNENPYLHPWHPEHEKHYNAVRSILFPHDMDDFMNMVVRRVSLTYRKDENNDYRFWLESEIEGTPIYGYLWFAGIGDYELSMPVSFVSVDDLERSIYSKIKDYVERELALKNAKDEMAVIGGVTNLWLLDSNGDGVIDDASFGQLRILRNKGYLVDDRAVSPRPVSNMYLKVAERIRKEFEC